MKAVAVIQHTEFLPERQETLFVDLRGEREGFLFQPLHKGSAAGVDDGAMTDIMAIRVIAHSVTANHIALVLNGAGS